MMTSFLAFVSVSLLVIMTPGPDTAVTIRNTLFGGRNGGIFTGLGVATGLTIWAFTTSIGIVALLVASKPLFLAVKYAGAAYLIFLGIQALRAAWHCEPIAGDDMKSGRKARTMPRLTAFRHGLVSDLGNPKIAVFFASLLPQFASGEAPFWSMLLLGLTFAAMTFIWLTIYAAVLAKIGDFVRRSRVRQVIEGVTGALLIALGLRIAAER